SSALAQDSCPIGLTNDSLPGKCGLYVDADGNDVCDLSETKTSQNLDTRAGGNSVEITETASAQNSAPGAGAAPAPRRASYHFWEILLITGILGLATELWLKKRSKDAIVLQTVWNWLLLLSFLGSALSGLYFVLPYDKRPALGFNFSYWHAVTGIIFIAVALYHTIRRFACLLGKPGHCLKNGACKEAKKPSE
ncbi:MAG: cytochrome b/b6 domain-containing protein, partial [bacterium]|nr:cytochrome b/b6 domain-containing protein [bacterium]